MSRIPARFTQADVANDTCGETGWRGRRRIAPDVNWRQFSAVPGGGWRPSTPKARPEAGLRRGPSAS